MFRKFLIFFTIFLSFECFSSSFTQFNQEGISFSIPSSQEWKELSKKEIDHIKDNASKITEMPHKNNTLIALESSKGKIRLSIAPLEQESLGIENDLIELLKPENLSEKRELISEMTAQQEATFKNLEQRSNMKVSNLTVSLKQINKHVAFVISYDRNNNNGNDNFYVSQHHFPDSKNRRTIILTLSYSIMNKADLKPILDEVISSLKF